MPEQAPEKLFESDQENIEFLDEEEDNFEDDFGYDGDDEYDGDDYY